jgi:hypothetical protein
MSVVDRGESRVRICVVQCFVRYGLHQTLTHLAASELWALLQADRERGKSEREDRERPERERQEREEREESRENKTR